jgi:hypothetical protein
VGRDHPELRRNVQLAFTLNELRQLAKDWGIDTPEAWDESLESAARAIVRQAERSIGTSELIRRLKQRKPLVEWPEIPVDDTRWQGVATPDARDGMTDVVAPMSERKQAPLPQGPIAPTLIDLGDLATSSSEAAPSEAAPSSAPASTAAPPSTSREPRGPPSAGMANPWISAPPKPETSSIPMRTAIVIGVVALATIGLAFGAGIFWRARGSAVDAKSDGVGVPHPLADRAILLFEDALVDVAQRCKLTKSSGFSPIEILGAAQDECGIALPTTRGSIPEDDVSSRERVAPKTKPAREREGPAIAPIQRDPTRGGTTCASKCAKQKSSCKSACGNEPSDASQYDAWQSCTSKCYASESRCRTSCH